MNKLIAFRSKDREGDVWCEEAFLFYTDADVKNFFKADSKELLTIFARETPVLNNFELHISPAGLIHKVTFTTDYAGDVEIVEMSGGFIINPQNL